MDVTPEPAASDPLIGRVIADRYRILGLLARGAMGAVYKAEQLQLGRLVAVKILKPRATQQENEEIRARFLREAAGLARLTHHNTVRILDFGVVRDLKHDPDGDDDAVLERPYLVMELVHGRTLRTLLRNGPLPPQRALRIASQIAASLREAHQEGLLHRDLKPSNILVGVDADGHDLVKVIDFGLVKDLSAAENDADLTAVGLVIGTPLYVPPEVVIGNPVDARADVYGVGVLLYQMLSGKPPFPEHGEIADILRRVVVLDAPPLRSHPELAELPEIVEWIVQRCMDKKPVNRFRDAHQVLIALRAAEQVLASPELSVPALGLEDGMAIVPEPLSATGSHASHQSLSRGTISQGALSRATTSQATLVPGVPAPPEAVEPSRRPPLLWIALLLGGIGLGLGAVAWLSRGSEAEPPAEVPPRPPEPPASTPAPAATPSPIADEPAAPAGGGPASPPLVAEPRTAPPPAAPAREVAPRSPPAARPAPKAAEPATTSRPPPADPPVQTRPPDPPPPKPEPARPDPGKGDLKNPFQ